MNGATTVENGRTAQIKWLTLLIYILLSALTLLSSWTAIKVVDLNERLPKDYITRLEYNNDIRNSDRREEAMIKLLDRIEENLNRLEQRVSTHHEATSTEIQKLERNLRNK